MRNTKVVGILLSLSLLAGVAAGQYIQTPPQYWYVVGAGALAARPATCTANWHVWICNGVGCTTSGEYHYCTALNTWTVASGGAMGPAGGALAGTYPNPTIQGQTPVVVSNVLRAVKYLNGAGTVVGIDLYNDAAIADYGVAATSGTLAWAIAQLPATGGWIRIGPGTYTISTTIAVTAKANVQLSGAGRNTVLLEGATVSGADLLFISTANAHSWTISDIYFSGLQSAKNGLHFGYDGYGHMVKNSWFYNFGGSYGCFDFSNVHSSTLTQSWFSACNNSINLSGSSTLYGNRIIGNVIIGGHGPCISGEYPFETVIADNVCISNGDWGTAAIKIAGSNGSVGKLTITGNVIHNANLYAIQLNHTPSTFGSVKNSIIANNVADGNTTYSIWLGTGEDNNTVTGNFVDLPIYAESIGAGTRIYANVGNAGTENFSVSTSGTAAALSATLTEARFPALDGDVTTVAGDLTTTIGAAKVAPAMMKASTFDAQSDGGTITWAIASVLNAQATVTLAGNRTLNITDPVVGGNYVLRLVQDATGSRTLALGTGCTWKVANAGAGAIVLTAAANAIDVLTFVYDGTNCYANIQNNFN